VAIDFPSRTAIIILTIAVLVPSSSDPGPRVYAHTDAGAFEEFYCFFAGDSDGVPGVVKGSLLNSSAHDSP
jgi:hypothetical protein